jgi:NADH-quinone oxidoreductase subunit N
MNYLAALPPLLMVLFACATLLVEVIARQRQGSRYWLVWFNAIGQALVGYSLFRQWQVIQVLPEPLVTLRGAVNLDGLALSTHAIVWLAMVTLLFISYRYLEIVQENAGEYYALAVFAQCGMYFMAAGADLIVLFLGLELTAISFYILVGFTRADRKSNEAALKYLLLGSVSTGFVLYGFSLLYGVSGSTAVREASTVFRHDDAFGLLATVTVLSGLLLKVSAAPFHNWAPDAYDGAPTPITGYLSVASKVASFAVLIRLLEVPVQTPHSFAQQFVVIAAVLSLTVGSIAAITQARVKRLFGYSGVAHAGYLLLGMVAGSQDGVFVYLLVYAVMNLGAFAVLTSLRRHGIAGEELSDLRGLSRTHPVHAALFAVLLLSLAGIPPTAGFIGKYYIFAALIRTDHVVLAAVAAAYVVVSLYFYFRLVREMYLESGTETQTIAASLGVRVALVSMSAVTLFIGLFPEPILKHAALLAEFAR